MVSVVFIPLKVKFQAASVWPIPAHAPLPDAFLLKIMTTGLAGGLTKPCKGILPAALTRIEDPPTAPLSLAAPKGAVFYALFYQLRPLMVVFFLVPIYRLTRKRVNQLFHRQLFILFVFS